MIEQILARLERAGAPEPQVKKLIADLKKKAGLDASNPRDNVVEIKIPPGHRLNTLGRIYAEGNGVFNTDADVQTPNSIQTSAGKWVMTDNEYKSKDGSRLITLVFVKNRR